MNYSGYYSTDQKEVKSHSKKELQHTTSKRDTNDKEWGGRRDSNPRLSGPQPDASNLSRSKYTSYHLYLQLHTFRASCKTLYRAVLTEQNPPVMNSKWRETLHVSVHCMCFATTSTNYSFNSGIVIFTSSPGQNKSCFFW
jgi:hypothetical protein